MVIVILLILNSCIDPDDRENKEYISVHIVNHTGEHLEVYAKVSILIFSVPSAVISSGNGQSVMVERGGDITVYGRDSHRSYGSRTFYESVQWDVY
jgi:hypothetical protein